MVYSNATTSGGCQISLQEYCDLVRWELEDWDYEDSLQSALDDSTTSVSVIDYTQFGVGDIIQIGTEMMYVSAADSNPITVRRGWRRTSAQSHPVNSTILSHTKWTDAQLKRWINESFGVMYPSLYVRATTSLTGSSTDYDYTLPADITEFSQIEKVEAQYGSNDQRYSVTKVEIRSEPPALYIPRALSGFTLTVIYTKPFDPLDSDDERTTLPTRAQYLPVYYAASLAIEQKEGPRSRYDAFVPKQDEFSVREGQQLQTGSYYYKNRFDRLLAQVKMPQRGCIINGVG